MIFQIVQAALTDLLGNASAGRYTVEGYQRQSHAADELVGDLRHVTVYYKRGEFPKGSSGWLQGPIKHRMTFAVEMILSAPSTVDLALLQSSDATAEQRQTALLASLEATAVADAAWNELVALVWNNLMDPRNAFLGLADGVIGNRWVDNVVKHEVAPRGEFVVLSGAMDYTCECIEVASGETGIPFKSIDLGFTISGDVSATGTDPAAVGARITP